MGGEREDVYRLASVLPVRLVVVPAYTGEIAWGARGEGHLHPGVLVVWSAALEDGPRLSRVFDISVGPQICSTPGTEHCWRCWSGCRSYRQRETWGPERGTRFQVATRRPLDAVGWSSSSQEPCHKVVSGLGTPTFPSYICILLHQSGPGLRPRSPFPSLLSIHAQSIHPSRRYRILPKQRRQLLPLSSRSVPFHRHGPAVFLPSPLLPWPLSVPCCIHVCMSDITSTRSPPLPRCLS